MDSDDDFSSGGGNSPSSVSDGDLALSPHPEEVNLTEQGGAGAGKENAHPASSASGVPGTPGGGGAKKRRRLGSPGASISFDGAHATPPSAIGGGLMPSPSKLAKLRELSAAPSSPLKAQKREQQEQEQEQEPNSSQISTGSAITVKSKGKKKDTGAGEAWEEVLERLGATAGEGCLCARARVARKPLTYTAFSSVTASARHLQPLRREDKNGRGLTSSRSSQNRGALSCSRSTSKRPRSHALGPSYASSE